MRLRPGEEHRVLHVLSNLSRQRGLRQRVIEATEKHGIPLARTEIHTCGWLAQVDENGGNIFEYRPHSRGAEDMALLVQEVLKLLGKEERHAEPIQREIRSELPGDPLPLVTVSDHGNEPDLTSPAGIDSSNVTAADPGGLSTQSITQHDQAA